MHQRSQPHAHTRHSFPQPSAPQPAASPSASPPRRRYQRHHPYTQPANNASSYSPSPPLLTETVSAPSAAAATAACSSLDTPLSLRAGADMSSSSTRSRHIHTPAQLHQSAATTNSPYSLVAQPPAPDSASYLHGTSHPSAAYPEPSSAGAYGQHYQHHHQSSAYRSQAPPYHNGHHHHHLYSMTAPSSIPMTTSNAIGHLHPSSMASLAHGDAASTMYLHPGSVPLSASTSPVVPPGARSTNGSSRPLTAEEKEIKRKVSHSAIEKRRRERTNAVLRELQDIVPGLSKPGKIQKLEILEAAADYIRQLTTDPASQRDRVAKSVRKYQYHHHNQHQRQSQTQIQGQYEHQQRHQYQRPGQEQVHRQHIDQITVPVLIPEQGYVRMDPAQHGQMVADHLAAGVPAEHAALGRSPGAPQHTAIATPMSECSNASASDSADEAPLISDATRLIATASSAAEDPSSMKVNFLLC
ncbi:hypothetical protein IWW45_006579 [Coemansia sp. RSA 485]|nr:hypothetical protein IWW45_006579 [Coemansia sp. RSA 485]